MALEGSQAIRLWQMLNAVSDSSLYFGEYCILWWMVTRHVVCEPVLAEQEPN